MLFELPVRVYLHFRARSVLLYDMKLNKTLPLTEEYVLHALISIFRCNKAFKVYTHSDESLNSTVSS